MNLEQPGVTKPDDISPAELTLGPSETIGKALKTMFLNQSEHVLVVDENEKFIGIASEQSVRNALNEGADLNDPINDFTNRNVLIARDGQTQAPTMEGQPEAEEFEIIPVLDDDDRIVDLQSNERGPYTRDIKQKRVAVVGLGYVGLTLAISLAEIDFQVTGIDKDPEVLEQLKQCESHFHEEGLEMYLERNIGDTFHVQEELEPDSNEIYIISVGTPVDSETKKPDLSQVKAAAEEVGSNLKKGDLVMLRSTVPLGATRDTVLPILENNSGLQGERDFGLVFAPERTVAGRALQEIRELPQVIGGIGTDSLEYASRLFKELTGTIVDVDSPEAAELCKMIDNSYRDLIFSYSNQIARLCEELGLDMQEVCNAVNMGYDRTQLPQPSPGVGGACLSKDPYILLDVGDKFDYIPDLVLRARESNEEMPHHVVDNILERLEEIGKDPAECKVHILGFAFKGQPETSDTRCSPTEPVVRQCLDNDMRVVGYDPIVSDSEIQRMGAEVVGKSEGFEGADVVIIMTNHPEFEMMNIYQELRKTNKPAVFMDGWHLFDPDDIREIEGIHYEGVGVG